MPIDYQPSQIQQRGFDPSPQMTALAQLQQILGSMFQEQQQNQRFERQMGLQERELAVQEQYRDRALGQGDRGLDLQSRELELRDEDSQRDFEAAVARISADQSKESLKLAQQEMQQQAIGQVMSELPKLAQKRKVKPAIEGHEYGRSLALGPEGELALRDLLSTRIAPNEVDAAISMATQQEEEWNVYPEDVIQSAFQALSQVPGLSPEDANRYIEQAIGKDARVEGPDLENDLKKAGKDFWDRAVPEIRTNRELVQPSSAPRQEVALDMKTLEDALGQATGQNLLTIAPVVAREGDVFFTEVEPRIVNGKIVPGSSVPLSLEHKAALAALNAVLEDAPAVESMERLGPASKPAVREKDAKARSQTPGVKRTGPMPSGAPDNSSPDSGTIKNSGKPRPDGLDGDEALRKYVPFK